LGKKGEKSVGVGRQYCGNTGKVSTCQVAVFGALSNGDYASMIDVQLYLPQDWCDNPARCEEAGIPEDFRTFKTKSEIALDMIKHQSKFGTSFDYVGGDGYYGNSIELAEGIEKQGLLYMLDIHSNQTIYTERPELEIPEKKGNKGRAPTRIKPTVQGVIASRYMESLSDEQWQHLTVRNTTKGVLTGYYHFKTVYIWDKENNQILRRLLVIRKTFTDKGEAEYKYSFSNANMEQYTPEGIA
jgi:SRSO17 transposase